MGQKYKVEIIEGFPASEPISLYRQGDFVDLCRGPHVPATGRLDAFKLTSVAGAYWRGDARNEQLQRLYGTAWATKQDLDAYLKRVEEAKQRDHRRLGQVLDLFSHPPDRARGRRSSTRKGAIVYNTLVDYVRTLYRRYGYTEVITPLVYKTELWKTSGHYDAFREDMFLMQARRRRVRREADELPRPLLSVRDDEALVPRPADPLSPTSAGSTASSRRARCRGSRASARSRRTTPTSTAPRSSSTARSTPSSRW